MAPEKEATNVSQRSKESDDPRYSFTQIIDADHFTIQRIAASIRRAIAAISSDIQSELPSSSTSDDTLQLTQISQHLQVLTPLLLSASWRLIRHDLSEDLVMRPAFVSVLGPDKGQQMADHDREDHRAGRVKLLEILEQLESILQQTAPPLAPGNSTRSLSALSSQSQSNLKLQIQSLCVSITSTFDSLAEHMAIESGEFLPYFESLIGIETSRRLAVEYKASLCLTPFLEIPALSTAGTKSHHGDAVYIARLQSSGRSGDVRDGVSNRRKLFQDEAVYIKTELSELRKMYDDLVCASIEDKQICQSMHEETEIEVRRLQIGKWRTTVDNMVTTGAGRAAGRSTDMVRNGKL